MPKKKKKMLKVNHSSCMSKTLTKAIIKRSDLDKKYLKKKQISLVEPTKSSRVTMGAGKAGKQVHFSVWKAGKAGISKMSN